MKFAQWIRFQWWWYTSFRTREVRDKMCMWIAFHLPKAIAKWAFIRVYTFGQRNCPSYEAVNVMTAWDFQQVPEYDITEDVSGRPIEQGASGGA